MKNINLTGNYNSTLDFVEQNKLYKEAEECFGKNWEAESDIEQIENLIKHLNEATYMFSETDNDTLLFWKEAVKKVPQMVIEEITSLVEFTKTDKQFGDPLGFSFDKEYKEIFAPLNLTLRYDE